MSKQIEFSKLKDTDTVMLLNCDDYMGDDGRPSVITMTVKKFIKDVLSEMMEDGLSPTEAYNDFVASSGDGDENHYLILIKNGKGYAVIGDDIE